mmetsp:Transcript_58811/g.86070  ORF Transcript_58811/g.86070 Transcript_58811/m.86070 type:complete len:156 (-) Transcript_58811:65-532(-)
MARACFASGRALKVLLVVQISALVLLYCALAQEEELVIFSKRASIIHPISSQLSKQAVGRRFAALSACCFEVSEAAGYNSQFQINTFDTGPTLLDRECQINDLCLKNDDQITAPKNKRTRKRIFKENSSGVAGLQIAAGISAFAVWLFRLFHFLE